MPSVNHIHRYIKWMVSKGRRKVPYLIKGEPTFRCNDACTHYLMQSLVIGQKTRCTKCDREMILDAKVVAEMTYPKCLNCRKTKEALAHQVASGVVEDILKGLPGTNIRSMYEDDKEVFPDESL